MQRLIVRLIDSQNPEALQASLRWLYSFVRPHRLAIAGLLGLSCLLYTSPSPRDGLLSRMPSSA